MDDLRDGLRTGFEDVYSQLEEDAKELELSKKDMRIALLHASIASHTYDSLVSFGHIPSNSNFYACSKQEYMLLEGRKRLQGQVKHRERAS